MKRVKLVTMISKPGATESTVSSATSWMIPRRHCRRPAGAVR